MGIEEVDYVIEPEETPEPEENEGQEEGAEEEAEAKEGDAEGGAGEKEPEEKRLPRKERQAIRAREHRALTEERTRRETVERENRDLQAQLARAVTNATERMTEVVARTVPQPKPMIDTVKERLREQAKQIRDDDPKTTERFLDSIPDIVKELAGAEARSIVGEEMTKFQRAQPAPPSPEVMRLEARFPWLFKDGNGGAVAAKANRIAAREGRNMNDPVVKEKTWAEAASKYAAEEGLEVYDNRGQTPGERSAAVARVSGTSGKNGGAGGGARVGGSGGSAVAAVKNNPVAKAAADKFYGKLKGDARYQRYFDEVVKPELDRAGARSSR